MKRRLAIILLVLSLSLGWALWQQPRGAARAGGVAAPVPSSITVADGDVAALIQAIKDANNETTHLGPDTITLAAGGHYTLTAPDNFEYGPNGLPPIASEIIIEGQGATIERAPSAPKLRLLYVSGGLSYRVATGEGLAAGNLTLKNVTLKGGLAKGGDTRQGGGGAGMGGAIFNQGTLTLSGVTLSGNTAQGGSSGVGNGSLGGGGIGQDAQGSNGGGFGGAPLGVGGTGGSGASIPTFGGGRIYTILITATDQRGNSSQKSVTVSVPHNQ